MSETQKTKRGEDIPVPKRGDFFKDLKKAATPEPQPPKKSDDGAKDE